MRADPCSIDRDRFRSDGVLFPLPVLSGAQASRYRAAVAELRGALPGSPELVRSSALCFPWAWELATDARVLEVVETLLGPEILVWGTLIICKPARTTRFVSWHQDGAYAPLDLDASVSAWIALTPSNPTNGCMRIVPGSHRRGIAHRQESDPDNLLDRGQEVDATVDETLARDVTLAPGEMSLHHFNTIHGSRPNRSDEDRVGFVIRFTTPGLRTCGFPVIQARGTHPCRHLTLARRPQASTLAESLRLYAACEGARSS